ncbi:MAG: hypothetical protein KAJ49_03735 [Arcobacteraceae bacterium]|nr:hypothetical protein [Arcobacteraceae bacterium]
MKINILLFTLIFTFLYSSDTYFYQNGKKVYISPVQEVKIFSLKATSTQSNLNYFTTPNNKTVGVNDEILIKTSSTNIDNLLIKYSLTLVKQLTKNIYLLKVKDKSTIFDISNRLYEDKTVQFAHPNFTRQIDKR